MSIHFHRLSVSEVKKETEDCIAVTFDIPAELSKIFAFTHGQNITLKRMFDGEEIRRSYSVCSAPYENKLTVAIKKTPYGLFSSWANENLKKGDLIEVLPPTGKFNTPLHPNQQKCYLAFAAGSGITPVISIIKSTLRIEPGSRFTLVYGNRSRSSIIFFEELESLKNKYMERFDLIHILSREKTDAEINFGRITPAKCATLAEQLLKLSMYDEIFLCGPEEMIFSLKSWLETQGVEQKKIHFELFTTPGKGVTDAAKQLQPDAPTHKSKITVTLDGRSFDFDLAFDSLSILDAALGQGADLPYACKGGMCATCKAKLTAGEVVMDVNWALDEEELHEGFILTCQSHPKTEKVTVNYDLR